MYVVLVTYLDFSKMWIDDSQNANFQMKLEGESGSCDCHMHITWLLHDSLHRRVEAHITITEQNCSFDTLNVYITLVLHRGGEKEKKEQEEEEEEEEKRNENL